MAMPAPPATTVSSSRAVGPVCEVRARHYRIDASRALSTDNHGVGLAIVKAIAKMHGGTVFANSSAGINTIGLTLPVRPVTSDGMPQHTNCLRYNSVALRNFQVPIQLDTSLIFCVAG
jgi:hypothetical protein